MPTKTWRGPAGGNWSNSANWLPVGVPAATDDVIFDATSLNCNLDVNGVCLSFDANTYGAKTFALNANNITVGNGIFRLGTGMTVTGTGILILAGATGGKTLTSNNVVWSGSIRFLLNSYAWGDNWTIQGNLTTAGNITVGGNFTISIGGSLTPTGNFASIATYVLNGTGTLNGFFASSTASPTIIINTSPSNTITLTTELTLFATTLIYTSGNVVVNTNHNLRTINESVLDTDRTSTGGNKINFFNLSSGNSHLLTLLSNLTITNNFINNSNNVALAGAFTIFIGNSITSTNPAASTIIVPITGPSSTIELNSSTSGSIAQSSIFTNLTINKTGGATVTINNSFTWGSNNKTLNLNSSTNFLTNSTTLSLAGTPLTILNASNSQFYNLTTGTQTINLN